MSALATCHTDCGTFLLLFSMAHRAGGLYGGIHFSTASALPTEQTQPPLLVPAAPAAQEVTDASSAPQKTPAAAEANESAAGPELSTKPSAGICFPSWVLISSLLSP